MTVESNQISSIMMYQKKKATFDDFKFLADQWLSDISEYEATFYNQLNCVKELMLSVSKHREKVHT